MVIFYSFQEEVLPETVVYKKLSTQLHSYSNKFQQLFRHVTMDCVSMAHNAYSSQRNVIVAFVLMDIKAPTVNVSSSHEKNHDFQLK